MKPSGALCNYSRNAWLSLTPLGTIVELALAADQEANSADNQKQDHRYGNKNADEDTDVDVVCSGRGLGRADEGRFARPAGAQRVAIHAHARPELWSLIGTTKVVRKTLSCRSLTVIGRGAATTINDLSTIISERAA